MTNLNETLLFFLFVFIFAAANIKIYFIKFKLLNTVFNDLNSKHHIFFIILNFLLSNTLNIVNEKIQIFYRLLATNYRFYFF